MDSWQTVLQSQHAADPPLIRRGDIRSLAQAAFPFGVFRSQKVAVIGLGSFDLTLLCQRKPLRCAPLSLHLVHYELLLGGKQRLMRPPFPPVF